MAFAKLNLARYHSLHKNRFNLATLFHIFSYHRTSLQIFLFHKFSCISLSQVVELEMPGNSSTIFRSSHRRCSVKKVFSNILWYSQENTCVGASLLINLQLISPVALLKRDSNTDFLVDLGQFLRTPILKNIWDQNVAKKNFDETKMVPAVWKLTQISQDWTKIFPIV